jgi:hypothetical protein
VDFCHCINIALKADHWIAQLPITTRTYPALLVFDGTVEVSLVEKPDTLEVVVKVGPDGDIMVTRLCETREYVYFPDPDKPGPAPDTNWKGDHPTLGVWSVETLRTFLARPDLVAMTPYVGFDVSWEDRVGDVVRCLAALRLAAGSRVDAILLAP